MIKNNTGLYINIFIIIIGSFLFIPFLGQVHLFDWDEINFAESAREMILTGDYLNVQINFQSFWEKPPFFIWMQVLSMKLFGINEFAARFPNAICGIITLLLLFNIGKKIINQQFAIIWVLAYTGSFLPFFYFKSGIIDPWFNLFIFLGLYFLFSYLEFDLRKKLNISLSALFIGLAILTKGPVGMLVYGITGFIYFAIKGFKFKIKISELILFLLILIITGGFWFLLQIFNGNYNIIQDFIIYQIRLFKTKDAGHGGFFLYHFIILLIGVFPASIFAIKSFKRGYYEESIQNSFKQIMSILFWAVLILFTIVKTKIIHYSSMCYFPITFLAASVICKIINLKDKYNNWLVIFLSIMGFLYAFIISILPVVENNKQLLINKGVFNDLFIVSSFMANASYSGNEYLIGATLLIAFLFVIYFRKIKNYKASFIALFLGSIIFIYLSVIHITPKIEKYSQNAAIEFFKSLKHKDCYIGTLRYKSYAQYFYADKQIPKNNNIYIKNWLLEGDIDKDAYFVVKIHKLNSILNTYNELELLYKKNGYAFLIRKKKN